MASRELALRVAPTWGALLIFGTVFARSIDPEGLQTALAAMTAVEQAAWLLLAMVIGRMLFASHSRAVLYSSRLRPLWRAPVSRWRWSTLLAPYSLVIGFPIIAVGWLWPWSAVAGTVGLASATHPLVIAAGGAGAGAWMWSAISLGYGLGIYAAFAFASMPTLLVALCIPGGWVLGAYAYDDLRGRPRRRPRWGRVLRPRGVLTNLVVYDLRTMMRTEEGFWTAAFVSVVPSWGLVFMLGRHDGAVGAASVVMGAVLSSWTLHGVLRLRRRQGEAFFPGRWPVGAGARLLSLLVIAGAPTISFIVATQLTTSSWTLDRQLTVWGMFPFMMIAPVLAALWTERSSRWVELYPVGTLVMALTPLAPAWLGVALGWPLAAMTFVSAMKALAATRGASDA